jgi:D-serine deaminase-like pyridoxal phosphate-dependent protein
MASSDSPGTVDRLATPALIVDREALETNLDTMSEALPAERLRPHVKAHKCTALARAQHERGHRGFTCATVREMTGMAAAGLGEDLLLANEVVDPLRLRSLATLVEQGSRVTIAVDSEETVRAAAAAGLREVLVDVNVGMPRCGCDPDDAGRIAELARRAGLEVRGVMGYEGHAVGIADRAKREELCAASMELLTRAHADVGGDVVSAGGTGTFDCNRVATEIQAGSYALMDTAYDELGLSFRQALFAVATVVSVSATAGYAVADCGLKGLGMDHGKPAIEGAKVWFCSDEHVTFAPDVPLRVGDRVRITPAHVDPTVAYHERLWLVSGDEVLESWDVDLRGW